MAHGTNETAATKHGKPTMENGNGTVRANDPYARWIGVLTLIASLASSYLSKNAANDGAVDGVKPVAAQTAQLKAQVDGHTAELREIKADVRETKMDLHDQSRQLGRIEALLRREIKE
jgi:hypothetical protein